MRPRHLAALVLVALAAPGRAANLNVITAVELKDHGTSVVLSVKGSKPPNFTTFSMADPPRFVIDLSESRFQGVPEDVVVQDGVVNVVKNLSYGSDASSIARVMIAFVVDVEPPEVRTEGDVLVVRVTKPAAANPIPVAANAARDEVAAEQAKLEQQAKASAEADRKAAEEATAARAAADQRARAEAADLAEAQRRRAEEDARAEAEVKANAEADARARAEADQRARQEAEAKASAQAEALAQAEAEQRARLDAEVKASAEADARAAEQRARQEAAARASAEADAQVRQAEARPAVEAEAPVAAPAAVASVDERAGELAGELLPAPRVQVREVGFRQLPGVSRVFIRTNATPRFTIQDVGENTIRVALENTRATRRNDTRFLDTSFFPSAVALVTPARSGASYVVDIKLRERVPYQQRIEGDMLAIDFERPASSAAADAGGTGDPSVLLTGAADEVPPVVPAVADAPAPVAAPTTN
jgi:hypothetical protein